MSLTKINELRTTFPFDRDVLWRINLKHTSGERPSIMYSHTFMTNERFVTTLNSAFLALCRLFIVMPVTKHPRNICIYIRKKSTTFARKITKINVLKFQWTVSVCLANIKQTTAIEIHCRANMCHATLLKVWWNHFSHWNALFSKHRFTRYKQGMTKPNSKRRLRDHLSCFCVSTTD